MFELVRDVLSQLIITTACCPSETEKPDMPKILLLRQPGRLTVKTRSFPSHPHRWFGFVVGICSISNLPCNTNVVPDRAIFFGLYISIG
jgi:hypothetical protein